MPYIVTTRTPIAQTEDGQWLYDRADRATPDVARRAVATLEEAIDWIASPDSPAITYEILVGLHELVTETGGTVGPLPDGTVIEVEQVDIREIAHRADFRWQTRRASDVAPEIIDAFNAKEVS